MTEPRIITSKELSELFDRTYRVSKSGMSIKLGDRIVAKAPCSPEDFAKANGSWQQWYEEAETICETLNRRAPSAEQQQQEPVKWIKESDLKNIENLVYCSLFSNQMPGLVPLYTHQQHHVSPAWTKLSDRCPEFSANRRVVIYTDGYDFNGEQFFHVGADELNESFFGTAAVQPEECRLASHWIYAEDLMNSITHQQPQAQGGDPAEPDDELFRQIDKFLPATMSESDRDEIFVICSSFEQRRPQAQSEPVSDAHWQIDKITRTCDAVLAECKRLSAENLELKTRRFARFNDDECWIYQGDGEDYLESLVCPVVISAAQLIEILKPRAAVPDVDKIMAQAQVFASSWSLVGGQFDDGSMLETAEQEKEALRKMLTAAAPARPGANGDPCP